MKKLSFVALAMLVVMFLAGQAMAGMGAPYSVYSWAEYGESYDDYDNLNRSGRGSDHYSNQLPVYSDTWIGNPDQYAEANSSMNVGGEGGGPVDINAAASGSVNVGGAPVSVDLHTYADNSLANQTYSMAHAGAYYSDRFTATASVFQLVYDYSYYISVDGYSPDAYAENGVGGYWEIIDRTAGYSWVAGGDFINEYVEVSGIDSDSDSDGGFGTLYADLIVGNEYEVWMDLYEDAFAQGTATAGQPNASLNMDYSVNVVPEPISTLLFVTGGTLLACRRFFFPKEDA